MKTKATELHKIKSTICKRNDGKKHHYMHRCMSGRVVSIQIAIPNFGTDTEGEFKWSGRGRATKRDLVEFDIWREHVAAELSQIAKRPIVLDPVAE